MGLVAHVARHRDSGVLVAVWEFRDKLGLVDVPSARAACTREQDPLVCARCSGAITARSASVTSAGGRRRECFAHMPGTVSAGCTDDTSDEHVETQARVAQVLRQTLGNTYVALEHAFDGGRADVWVTSTTTPPTHRPLCIEVQRSHMTGNTVREREANRAAADCALDWIFLHESKTSRIGKTSGLPESVHEVLRQRGSAYVVVHKKGEPPAGRPGELSIRILVHGVLYNAVSGNKRSLRCTTPEELRVTRSLRDFIIRADSQLSHPQHDKWMRSWIDATVAALEDQAREPDASEQAARRAARAARADELRREHHELESVRDTCAASAAAAWDAARAARDQLDKLEAVQAPPGRWARWRQRRQIAAHLGQLATVREWSTSAGRDAFRADRIHQEALGVAAAASRELAAHIAATKDEEKRDFARQEECEAAKRTIEQLA